MTHLIDHTLTQVNPEYRFLVHPWIEKLRLKGSSRILIVVDTEIAVDPASNFGISMVVKLLRETRVSCMSFKVDIALRSDESFSALANPSDVEPKYRGFRFNSAHNGGFLIWDYDQIWCFGFKPNNSGSTDDSIIDQSFAIPASENELIKLDQWMTETKGGLFGTGDHHFLGASMCRRIPRLGTMRRWTNADGVPSLGGTDRIDTLRPPPLPKTVSAPENYSVLATDCTRVISPSSPSSGFQCSFGSYRVSGFSVGHIWFFVTQPLAQ